MDLHQLKAFLAVLEHRSFSQAAHALRLSQSTVSFHVKVLESSLGKALFRRQRDKVVPTEYGKRLRQKALRMVSLEKEIIDEFAERDAHPMGHVRLAASTVAAEYLLPPFLAVFQRMFPQVSLSVEVLSSRAAIERVLQQTCDFAVVGQRPGDRRIVSQIFAEDEIVLIDSGDKIRHGSNDNRRVLIQRLEGSGTQQAAVRLVRQLRDRTIAALYVGSSEALKNCVAEGMGLGFVSKHAITQELKNGSLRIVACEGTPLRRYL